MRSNTGVKTGAFHPRITALVEEGLGPAEASRPQIAQLGPEGQEFLATLMETELRMDPGLKCDPRKRAEYWRLHVGAMVGSVGGQQQGEEPGEPSDGDVCIASFANVTPKPISWLWRGFIPLSAVTILDGDPGLGKSTLMIEIAARISRGVEMPGDPQPAEAAGVLLLSAEDDPQSVIRPRLDVAGADTERVLTIQMAQSNGPPRELLLRSEDLQRVEPILQESGVKLVVVDPFVAFLPGEVNANRDQDVRRAMAQLRGLAERSTAAVVVVRHLRKAWSENALYRGGGSIGIIGAARAGLLVAADPTDTTGERRILAVTKMNLAPMSRSRAFRLVASEGASHPRVVWEGESDLTARALLVTPQSDEERGARREAEEFLEDLLSDGPCPASEVEAQARQAGIAKSTLRRAKISLGVKAGKVGRPGEDGQHWKWALPSKVINEA